MKTTAAFALILVLALALGLADAQGTCPGGTGACSCQLNNVDSLRALIQMEVEAQVQAEVTRRFACTDFTVYRDCQGALNSGCNTSGVYRVQPDDLEPFDVYCDMETDGGGWTVIQRRQDGSVDFYRYWNDYVSGFGSLTGEFWLGLDKIHRLTNRTATRLRVDLGDFEGNTTVAKYDMFQVLNFTTNYTLSVSGYTGTAGDSLAGRSAGSQFTTRDRDNDVWPNNCAVAFGGAWWYSNCHASNLNGRYHAGSHDSFADGVNWQTWRGYRYSLRFSEMKLR